MARSGEGLSGWAGDDSPAQVLGRYDEWADQYEADVLGWGYTLPDAIMAVAHAAGLRPGAQVLDAGCGSGLIGVALAAAGHEASDLTGADGSASLLDVAARAGRYGQVVELDLTKSLPFADNAFGGVVCGGVLTYITDAAPLLDEFLRVAAPEAPIVVSQRTDLWIERDFEATLEALRARGVQVECSERRPYLPELAEYGEEIEIIFVTLRSPAG